MSRPDSPPVHRVATGSASAARSGCALGVPRVSVVIPCYRQAHFLGEALESVLAQTTPAAEIIVVDDGSPDDTHGVAAQYADCETVQYLRQTNQGLPGARNTGLHAATGDYVVFLDADDRLRPEALAAGLACFDRYPEAAFVAGGFRLLTHGGVPYDDPKRPEMHRASYAGLLRGNTIGMHAAVLYRRAAVVAAGGFDPSLPSCEDYDLFLRIARTAPLAFHGAVVAEYRQHPAGMSTDAGRMMRTVRAVLKAQRPHVQHDARLRAAQRDGLRACTTYYGRPLLAQIKTHLRTSSEWSLATKKIITMAQHAPQQMAGEAGRTGLKLLKEALPKAVKRGLRRLRNGCAYVPPAGDVDFGDFRRTEPISRSFGFDRGLPIDRHYIERFLKQNAAAIQGRVLEIGDDEYTRRFGEGRVEQSDVLHVHAENPKATFVGDLTDAEAVPSGAFDCAIITQTLHLIYDVKAALETLRRILKPGGVLLVTGPGISQVEDGEWGKDWQWSFTPNSLQRLLEEAFPSENVRVEAHGNVLAAVSLLQGIAADELTPAELEARDPLYPVLLTARAVKPAIAARDAAARDAAAGDAGGAS